MRSLSEVRKLSTGRIRLRHPLKPDIRVSDFIRHSSFVISCSSFVIIHFMSKKVRVGLIGSRFISAIHADALKQVGTAELFAVASPTKGNARAFAKKHGFAHHFTDYRKLLEMDEIDMVVLGIPNDLHCQITV